MSGRRVVITGLEVLAPGGVGTDAFWSLLSEGRTATRGITFFDPSPFRSRVAAEIDFDPEAHGLGPQEIRRMDRAGQFAVVAARGALADSGLDLAGTPAHRTGVTVGTAVGATMGLDQEYRVVSDGGRLNLVDHTYAVPHLYNYLVPSSFAAEVAWAVGAEGANAVVSTGCTSGIDAIGYAIELIREGSVDTMIAGATDAPISPITMACFDAIRATTPRHDEPERASRPFDSTRNGFVLGEGSAFFVLEELENARRRGARVYAEIAGYATRSNAYHMTGLRPDGAEMAEAIRVALDEARMNPEQIDYINAHGSGTKQNDRHETAAFKKSLGEHAYATPVSSIKSMVGHSLGAIGAIEIAASTLAMTHHVVPPTANLHEPDPECDLDYVPVTAREHTTDAVLTVGSGFGGFQSAMVLARPERTAA
ncbi:beta-ketoacyl-[acyl-carrier-protein] synthase family protein [Streptomyces sp. AD681]|uniref:beta-ketoacyl-[acyl-carrier-protein] synthase family protein n=1 Tax=Streptomyces sp. AD681 TaxID=3019069 RepID=UPI0022F14782|nr:beta-ketoacyl-[acyl-carrier-protein] synthase family protein [Streptomyces sp. AD681]MDA5146638.1 beta-ketoacyl-[acyl-carrier-protein] synthase family protein [Streptomyces sp. AD681]